MYEWLMFLAGADLLTHISTDLYDPPRVIHIIAVAQVQLCACGCGEREGIGSYFKKRM